MKTATRLILFCSLIVLAACRGEDGPPGPPGQDGLDGDLFLPQVFEAQYDFLPENDFTNFFEFPNTIEVLESDVVLVYLLWDSVENNDGEMLDVWRLLPQTIILNEGILQYNYDHTFTDVSIFLDGTLDFDTLLPEEALDQVFRIVVFPADFAAEKLTDVEDYNLMLKSLGVNPAQVKPEVVVPAK